MIWQYLSSLLTMCGNMINGNHNIHSAYRNADAIIAEFPNDFMFGLATAPAHVEDQLNDGWLEWGIQGKTPFFLTVPQPERRLDFWTHPEVEIDIAADSGVKVLRIGVDWGRLVPHEPGKHECSRNGFVLSNDQFLEMKWSCRDGIQDWNALEHYLKILAYARQKGLTIMLTLFHHSPPKWALPKSYAGWTNEKLVINFVNFVSDLIPHVAPLVDKYIILNEPAVYANLVYGFGIWPGRLSDKVDAWAYWHVGSLKGSVIKSFENLAKAHNIVYDLIKEKDTVIADNYYGKEPSPSQIGVAHNIAWYVPGSPKFFTKPVTSFVDYTMNIQFMDMIAKKLDFIGINYYGKEVIVPSGPGLVKGAEYSDSGRAISPEGFHVILQRIHDLYNVKMNRNLDIIITENGIADSTDILRPAYLVEHLMVIQKCREEGIPIAGYIHWTISDNLEWADGYCPKFGLVSVDRATLSLERTYRDSFFLFRDIVQQRNIKLKQRVESWKKYKRSTHAKRLFCRDKDGKGTVTKPTYRGFSNVDWRFNYKLNMFPRFRWWPWV